MFPDERMVHMGFIRMCLKIYIPYTGGKGISIQKREMKKIEVKIIWLVINLDDSVPLDMDKFNKGGGLLKLLYL